LFKGIACDSHSVYVLPSVESRMQPRFLSPREWPALAFVRDAAVVAFANLKVT
jgi:hypothetical protein